jgi:hypothetical protein
MNHQNLIKKLIKVNGLTGSDQEISDELRRIYGSKRAMFMEEVLFLRIPLFVYVFESGIVCLIFKDKQYLFENPFGKHLSGTFQLFVQDDIVVLFSGLMFVSFVFEKGGFSKIEYKSYPEWHYKRFVKGNVILLSIGRMILSFTLENEIFTKCYYPIRYRIDGGILTFVRGIPYFVCCIHPRNFPLIVVSINLITGQQNTVLEMAEDEHFRTFETRDGSLFIMTFDTQTLVDPLKIHETRESFLPSNFVSNKPLDVSCGSKMVALIISGHPVEVLIKPNRYNVHIFFKGTKYTFKRPFGDDHSSQKLQLFSYDNMIVLLSESESSGRKFALFMYEGDVFTKIEFSNRKGSAFRFFVKHDLIVLCARDKALSFIQEFGNFTMRYYSILHRIDGGILTVDKDIQYLVACVNPVDSETNLKVVSINLLTKEQKKVLEMEPENRYMAFAQLNGHLYLDTTSIAFLYRDLNQCRTLVDPSKNVREDSFRFFSDC